MRFPTLLVVALLALGASARANEIRTLNERRRSTFRFTVAPTEAVL